jgi:hypothetical protein
LFIAGCRITSHLVINLGFRILFGVLQDVLDSMLTSNETCN